MATISQRDLAHGVLLVEGMGVEGRLRLAEEIHERQPNLFYSVLVLHRYGATMEQIEVVLNLLLVLHAAMECSGRPWPLISEATQERCLRRVSGRVRFIEGLTPEQQTQATSDAVNEHPERLLLAYLFGKFQEHDLIGVKTEAEKMLMLAALNLVECIADAGARNKHPAADAGRER